MLLKSVAYFCQCIQYYHHPSVLNIFSPVYNHPQHIYCTCVPLLDCCLVFIVLLFRIDIIHMQSGP